MVSPGKAQPSPRLTLMGQQLTRSQKTNIHTTHQGLTPLRSPMSQQINETHPAQSLCLWQCLQKPKQQTIVVSIKAIYTILGESDLSRLQDPASFDKLEEAIISYSLFILGNIVNTQRMDVKTPPKFISEVQQTLRSKWGLHWTMFLLEDFDVGHITSMTLWLSFLTSIH